MAHLRQSRPDSGLGFQVKALEPFKVVLSCLASEAEGRGRNVGGDLELVGEQLLVRRPHNPLPSQAGTTSQVLSAFN